MQKIPPHNCSAGAVWERGLRHFSSYTCYSINSKYVLCRKSRLPFFLFSLCIRPFASIQFWEAGLFWQVRLTYFVGCTKLSKVVAGFFLPPQLINSLKNTTDGLVFFFYYSLSIAAIYLYSLHYMPESRKAEQRMRRPDAKSHRLIAKRDLCPKKKFVVWDIYRQSPKVNGETFAENNLISCLGFYGGEPLQFLVRKKRTRTGDEPSSTTCGRYSDRHIWIRYTKDQQLLPWQPK